MALETVSMSTVGYATTTSKDVKCSNRLRTIDVRFCELLMDDSFKGTVALAIGIGNSTTATIGSTIHL
jgi:hypothetical protein